MRTKKELNELSNAIGKAERAYYDAIEDNLKESVKEHIVESDDEDEDGLHVTTTDRHDNNVIAVIDKIRFNTNCGVDGLVEVHVCAWDYVKKDYWADIQLFDSDVKPCVYDNIIW
jgi:hypothetical protein